ncbi:hypothetical protein [Paraprevotella xylaniphila]
MQRCPAVSRHRRTSYGADNLSPAPIRRVGERQSRVQPDPVT